MVEGLWAGSGVSSDSHPWLTVAPVHPHWKPGAPLDTAFQFDEGLALARLPDWLRGDDLLRDLSFPNREAIKIETTYALVDRYSAASHGEPDPDWQGPHPRSKQDRARERILLANLALWLVQPTCIGFTTVIDVDRPRSNWALRGSEVHPRLLPLESYKDDEFPTEKLTDAKAIFASLKELSRLSNLWPGVRSLWSALTQPTWEVRFLLLWVVMESLYGSESPQETTFRLSQRVALFLAPSRTEARHLFERVKAGYAWRSRVAHGMQPNQMRKLTAEQSLLLSSEVESLVRLSYLKVLPDAKIRAVFEDPSKREGYLDGAVYAE